MVNDCYSHDFGDILIMDAGKMICRTFSHSPVYRIGGDEFVVILEHEELRQCSSLLEQFQKNLNEHNRRTVKENKLIIARGIAIYSSETDFVFANVFKQTDDAMYQNKAAEMRIRDDEEQVSQ